MKMVAMRIIPPAGKTPLEFSANKPCMSRLGTGWHKVDGYIVPLDGWRIVPPHCVFFLAEDLLWHTIWVTANRTNDAYYNAMHWNKFAEAVRLGRIVESSPSGMSYNEMMDMVRRAFGRVVGTDLCKIQPAELYAEFGAKVEFCNPRDIYFDTHEEGNEQMLITL